MELRPSIRHINWGPQLLRDPKFDVYKITVPRMQEVYLGVACRYSRLAYKLWYVIMLSMYLRLGVATSDKPCV